jgi:cytoskeletal protein RodZ
MSLEIGQQLRQAREARSLSLEQVSQATHIRINYLKAMEAGDFEDLPSPVQARGFLRAYASYLGLEASSLLAEIAGKSPAVVEQAPAATSPVKPPPARPLRSRLAVPPQQAPGQTLPKPSPVSPEAQFIFIEIGQRLQKQRDLLGLSLDDVVRHTHLRQHYLVALESGNLDGLPSPVQGRGMLNNYATFLGLNPEPLLLRFAEGLQSRLKHTRQIREETEPEPHPKKTRRQLRLPAPLRRLLSSDFLIGSMLTMVTLGLVIWAAIRIFSLQNNQEPSPTARSVSEVLLTPPTPLPNTATPTPEATATTSGQLAVIPVEDESTSEATLDGTPEANSTPSSGNQGVQVYLTVHQRAWVRVRVDGEVAFEGRMVPGSAYTYSAEEQVEILTGNAAALQVFFNQQDLGLLGQFGQVVNRIYTVDGVQSPTPSVTPTSTPTPRSSPTPQATATPQITIIPRTATSPALP